MEVRGESGRDPTYELARGQGKKSEIVSLLEVVSLGKSEPSRACLLLYLLIFLIGQSIQNNHQPILTTPLTSPTLPFRRQSRRPRPLEQSLTGFFLFNEPTAEITPHMTVHGPGSTFGLLDSTAANGNGNGKAEGWEGVKERVAGECQSGEKEELG